MAFFKTASQTIIAIIMLLSLIACSSDDSSSTEVLDPAELRIINLIPDSPIIRLDINSTSLANVSFGQASTFNLISGGTYELEINYQDADLDDDIQLFLETEFALTDVQATTVFLTGPLESPTMTTLSEAADATLESGEAEIRFFNGFGEFDVDIYLSSDSTSTSINGISPLASTLNDLTDADVIDSGDYRLLVTRAGDDQVIYDSGAFTLASQTRRLFTINSYFGLGGEVRIMQISATSSSTMINEAFPSGVRIANMIPDLGEVDIYIDGVALDLSLDFESLTSYHEISAGTHKFDITLDNQPAAIIYSDNRQLIAGEQRTLVLSGLNNSNQVQGRFILDDRRSINSAAQLRIINAAPGGGNLDAYLLIPGQLLADANPIFSNMTLLTNGVTQVEGRSYDLEFTKTAEETVILGPERLNMVNSGIYSVFIIDAAGGGTPSDFVLADDFVQ